MRTGLAVGRVGWRPLGEASFTLAEMMVSMALFMVVLAGVITGHMFGVRMFQLTKAKLGANDAARIAISRMTDEIRSAKVVAIGNGDENSFTNIAMNAAQQGTAIQVYPTLDPTRFVRYFWDPEDKTLKRSVNGSAAVAVIANNITNSLVFTSENFSGQVLTNDYNNRVIGMTLQFYQIQYPIVRIGPGNYYDFYQFRTKITRRTLE